MGSEQKNIPVYEFKFTNVRPLNIGKTDITTGEEIGGAHLVVTGLNDSTTSEGFIGNIVDEWDSEAGKTHKVMGIKPNNKYTEVSDDEFFDDFFDD